MAWIAAGAAIIGGAAQGGLFGGGGSEERNAKDAAAANQLLLTEAQANLKSGSQPFINTGTESNKLLAQYLGVDTSGYAPRPTREQAAAEISLYHYQKYGKDYDRNSSRGWIEQQTENLYQKKLADWEKGLDKYKEENAGSMGDGRLLKEFGAEDFEKDPGHNFELAEGEKGIDRALAARGGRNSGAALKAIARYNSDFASTKFNQAFNRDTQTKNNTYNFLAGQSSQALGAVQQNGQNGIAVASNIGNSNQNLANTLLGLSQNQQDNQANAITNAVGNAYYAYQKNKNSSVTGGDANTSTTSNPSAFQTSQWWGGS